MSSPSSGTAPPPSYSTVVRNRRFLALWLGRMASFSGDAVFDLAIIWYVLVSTGSVLLVGLTLAATYVVDIALGPVAGAVVDRWNRRSVVLATYAGQAVVVGVAGLLYAMHDLSYVVALSTVLLVEVGYQLTLPAHNAMVPGAVRKAELLPANGLISGTSAANTIASTAVGGLLVGFLGFTIPFEYDAVSFVLAMGLIAVLPRALDDPHGPDAGEAKGPAPSSERLSFAGELREGLAVLRRDRALLELTLLGTLVSLFAMGLQGLYAPYALEVLQGGASLYGFLTVSFAVGSVVGGFLVGHFGRRARAGRLIVLGLTGQSASIAALGLIRAPALALGIKGIGGVSQETNIVPWTALQQARIPRKAYGRVSSLVNTIINAPSPVAVLLTAYVATRVSLGTTFLLYGLAMLATVGIAVVLSRELRSLGPVETMGPPAPLTRSESVGDPGPSP